MMDDKESGIVTAVLGLGLLSPILDRVDVRQARELTEAEFNRMVWSIYGQGRCTLPDDTWTY